MNNMERHEPFTYSPLGQHEIRIITLLPDNDSEIIRCSLEHVSLDENPDYEALSYTWGADEVHKSILVDGKSVGVGRNLWFALYHFRQRLTHEELLACIESDSERAVEQPGTPEEPLRLWIDALCIDQSNDTERSSQVQMMGSIYEKSERLRIWLGEQTPQTVTAMAHFQASESGVKIALDDYGECICEVERTIKSQYSDMEKFFDKLLVDYRNISMEITIRQPELSHMLRERAHEAWVLGEGWLYLRLDAEKLLRATRDISSKMLSDFEKAKYQFLEGNATLKISHIDQKMEYLLQRILDMTEWTEEVPVTNYDSMYTKREDFRIGLLDICRRDYWNRLWVVQEVVLGCEPVIYCGTSELSWEKFSKFLSVAYSQGSSINKTNGPESVLGFDFSFSKAIKSELRNTPAVRFSESYSITVATGVRTIALRSLISSFHKAQTKDPRDMVYGLLALAEPSHAITPDYSKSAAELYDEVLEASLWDGNDDYLVSFSHLLQKVLGEPFWDGELPKCSLRSYKKHGNLVLSGVLGKRISWETSISMLTVLNGDEIETLPSKQQVWLGLSLPFKRSQNVPPFSSNTPRTFYRQKFTITPYGCYCRQKSVRTFQTKARDTFLSFFSHKTPKSSYLPKRPCSKHERTGNPGNIKEEEGSVLLSTPSTNEDYLCFFKDCDVAAVVRGNEQGSYSIVGHCVVDHLRPLVDSSGDGSSPLEDWTMKCKVEMSRETLQRLTM